MVNFRHDLQIFGILLKNARVFFRQTDVRNLKFFVAFQRGQSAFGVSNQIEILLQGIVQIGVQLVDRTTKIVQVVVDLLFPLIEKIVISLLHRCQDHVELENERRQTFDLRFGQRRIDVDRVEHVDDAFAPSNERVEFPENVHFAEIERPFRRRRR